MGHRLRRIVTSAGAATFLLLLSGCTNASDSPTVFGAVVTVTGIATEASPTTGQCTVGGSRVQPGDELVVLGDSGRAFAKSPLAAKSITQRANGTSICTFTARFDRIAANQRAYGLSVGSKSHPTHFAEKSFSMSELRSGATLQLEPE